MRSKLQQIHDALACNDARTALRIASTFPALGAEKRAVMRGWEACARPELYRQMGYEPQMLIDEGIAALRRRYGQG